MHVRFLSLAAVLSIVSACHTVPNANDPYRQKRIDDCLKQCGNSNAGSANTAYESDVIRQQDSRSSCEKRCHSIP